MQKMCFDLEIDVNGQGTFLINKKIIVSYSGRLRKLFRKSKENAGRFKVIFHDFPGGSQSFELVLRFCYSGGRLNISSSNIMLLHSAAIFLEMGEDGPRLCGLIREMSWSELLECLKQSQNLLHFIRNSVVLQDLMESLVGRISMISAVSPNVSYSTDSSSCKQFSGDISGESTSKYSSQTNNSWFEDLDFLRIDLAEKLVRTMIISKKIDEYTVSCFLFHYQKMKKAEGAEKRKIAETVIILLDLLEEKSLISARCLFDNLQVSMVLRLGKSHKRKVESLIGSVLDRAKLDDLLFPSPSGKSGAYDVDLVSRIQKQFLLGSKKKLIIYRLKKVAVLMDSYIAEVAPDRCLQPEKFAALATALPVVARDSHDGIYYALDLYLRVHDKICVEEKIKICGVLDYNKLSIGCLMDLCDNMNFPASARMRASFSQSRNLKLGRFPRKMGCVWSFEDDDDSKSTQTSARTLEKLDYQTIDHIFM